ncbi:excinuclease ATPase subunit [Alkalimonas sp.]|uniref:excinuclease ATPase subunit n=1 Tax=Alkalimonas sp. TaxID=1872453 RepID=UPI00263ABB6D|nr:excinuclease ATPase subunit [Alkalimonas sp.]MCC5826847.1 excinuclease ATPase subunit [Alkalimonas sp.]
MNIQSAFASGMQGVQSASDGMSQSTLNINRQTQRPADPVAEAEAVPNAQQPVQSVTAALPSLESSLIDLTVQQRLAEANVRSIETASSVLGTLIDTKA